MIITIKTNESQIQRAKDLYPFESLNGSITAGEGNDFGALAEIAYIDYLESKGHKVDYKGSYDYDMIVDGHKVDVKAKHILVKPKLWHNVSLPNWNTTQRCDYYFFAFIKKDLSEVYLLGYMGKEEFLNKATMNPKGSEDWNGWKFKADTWNVKVNMLNRFAQ